MTHLEEQRAEKARESYEFDGYCQAYSSGAVTYAQLTDLLKWGLI